MRSNKEEARRGQIGGLRGDITISTTFSPDKRTDDSHAKSNT